jgi:hypothetical protein
MQPWLLFETRTRHQSFHAATNQIQGITPLKTGREIGKNIFI